jgi:hypothetical protein
MIDGTTKRWLGLGVLAACAACNGPGKDASGEDTGPTASETGSTDTDTDTDTEPTDPGAPSVTGILVDPSGAPVPYGNVLCCTLATCFVSETEADGSFHFPLEPGSEVALKTHFDLYVVPRWGAALEPAVIGDAQVDLGTVHIPDLPAGAPVGDASQDPQTLAAGDGLELTLNRADLTPELGVFIYDVAARQLPEAWIPPYPGLEEPVLAVYALHPFATESASPIGVSVPSDLPDGSVVHFRSISHLDGSLSAPAVGHVDGGRAATDPGEGIPLLTHVVVSAP